MSWPRTEHDPRLVLSYTIYLAIPCYKTVQDDNEVCKNNFWWNQSLYISYHHISSATASPTWTDAKEASTLSFSSIPYICSVMWLLPSPQPTSASSRSFKMEPFSSRQVLPSMAIMETVNGFLFSTLLRLEIHLLWRCLALTAKTVALLALSCLILMTSPLMPMVLIWS